MEGLICPLCRRLWDRERDRWIRGLAAPGRVPPWLWTHRRPDNDKPCSYADAGAAPEPPRPWRGAALDIGRRAA